VTRTRLQNHDDDPKKIPTGCDTTVKLLFVVGPTSKQQRRRPATKCHLVGAKPIDAAAWLESLARCCMLLYSLALDPKQGRRWHEYYESIWNSPRCCCCCGRGSAGAHISGALESTHHENTGRTIVNARDANPDWIRAQLQEQWPMVLAQQNAPHQDEGRWRGPNERGVLFFIWPTTNDKMSHL
jgi:hypothetical protein